MAKVIPMTISDADDILSAAIEYDLDEVLVLGIKNGEPMLFHTPMADIIRVNGMLFEMMMLLREPGEE